MVNILSKLNIEQSIKPSTLTTGALYDNIGNYDAGFYFAGSMIFLSGAMLFAIPAIQQKIKNKKPSFKIHSGGKDDDDLLTEP